MEATPGVVNRHEVDAAPELSVRAHRQSTPLAQALAATGNRWTLLIALALADEAARLNALRERLPGISSAVLDHHVREMVEHGLLTRRRFREMPPRVELELTDAGKALLPIAGALARWGMRHRWSAEAGCRGMSADAVIRQLPALLEGATLPPGTVEAVLDHAGDRRRYRFEIVDGTVALGDDRSSIEEPDCANAQIEGEDAGWIAALGPDHDYAALRFSGRRELALNVLDALPR